MCKYIQHVQIHINIHVPIHMNYSYKSHMCKYIQTYMCKYIQIMRNHICATTYLYKSHMCKYTQTHMCKYIQIFVHMCRGTNVNKNNADTHTCAQTHLHARTNTRYRVLYRMATKHLMPYGAGLFPQKTTNYMAIFAKNDL